jgi:hypothetical protein
LIIFVLLLFDLTLFLFHTDTVVAYTAFVHLSLALFHIGFTLFLHFLVSQILIIIVLSVVGFVEFCSVILRLLTLVQGDINLMTIMIW